MARLSVAAILVVAMVGGMHDGTASGQTSDLAGRWTLNRDASQFPREIGFTAEWMSAGAAAGQGSTAGGGRGRRGASSSSAAGAFPSRPESADDAKRRDQLTAEVRNPPARLTVVDTPAMVTITDERGQSRTFHPGIRQEVLLLDGVPVGVTSKREAGRLIVLYNVEEGRDLRYTYSRAAGTAQLVVDVQFVQRGGGDEVKRIYEPASATETAVPATPAPSVPGANSSTLGRVAASVGADRGSAQTFNQQPGAELKGLTKLGIVVEDLSAAAATCGLSQSALETAVAKRLSDAGFTVLRNSDEDTYVYVSVITTSLSTGLCVSRYDAFLYTHTTAKLSYQDTPVLVEVSLLHKGGIAGGAAAAHAASVLRGVEEYVDQFSTRIHQASK
jgi:hypothetical protein